MSALVIDTSSWVSYFDGKSDLDLIDDALAEGRAYISPVVAAELLSARMNDRQRAALEDLLADLPLCASDLPHWYRVGKLRARLASRGLVVSTPDAHIAQCAIDLAGEILSEDKVFQHIAARQPLRLARPHGAKPHSG